MAKGRLVFVLLILSLLLNIYLVHNFPLNYLGSESTSNVRLNNINAQSISIADSVKLVNLFNPDILGSENIGYSIAHVTMEPGSSIPLRSLAHNEVQYYIKGSATITVDGTTYHVTSGDALFVPKNSRQVTVNNGDTPFTLISVVEPAWNPDIEVRYS